MSAVFLCVYSTSEFVCLSRGIVFFCFITGEAGAEVETGADRGSVGGQSGGGRGLAGNWVLTELLPHGPTPTGRVLHRRDVAATIAASPL